MLHDLSGCVLVTQQANMGTEHASFREGAALPGRRLATAAPVTLRAPLGRPGTPMAQTLPENDSSFDE
ncbi:hypothetical protein E2C01_081073 [Portunus trituberculatus]|uniref:Uncharacterized protein n=1 Tax=Portunus trituberculatus TaxID=210409 RepID=A0A5B7INV6_PORTR|nr:hypothetical protein [Portunus trituberculatus]